MDYGFKLNEIGISYKEVADDYVIPCISGTHSDNHPSMRVDKETGIFNCFSCEFSGTFSKLYYHVTGKPLNKKSFLDLSSDKQHRNSIKKRRKKRPTILHTEGDIKDIDEQIMPFLHSIGVYSQEFIDKYNLSYTGFSRFIAEDKHKDGQKATAFYKRLLIPIYKNGKLVNIEGRALELDIKPKVIYVKGGLSDLLFNLENIDPTKPVIMVEGIKDFFKVWNIDRNVIACLGNQLGRNQLEELNKYIPELIAFLDDDEAGLKILDQLEHDYERDFSIIDSGEGKDPNNLTLEEIYYKLTNEVESYGKFLHRKYIRDNNQYSL
ncbi:MAG: toprim domain-containing protein [Candidatus Woesearchaeota archaeon]|nr:toprim domain-containing protein [Candidatus Woesearchaeota archaeon]